MGELVRKEKNSVIHYSWLVPILNALRESGYVWCWHFVTYRALSISAGLTLAPLVVKVDPNLNVILTACLTVFVGCYRSVKPTPPSVSTVTMLYVSISCFLLDQDQILMIDLHLCRRQCLMNMPCVSLLLGARCCYHYFYSLSSYPKTW